MLHVRAMIRSSLAQVRACGVTMMPPFSLVTKEVIARSISGASWTPPDVASTPKRGCSLLQRTPERLLNGRLGMHDHHHPRDLRYGLFQHLKPPAPDRAIQAGETGDVAARMSEARDEPIANRIANPNKYDGYRARHALEQSNCWIAERHDHVWRERNEFPNNGPHLVYRTGPPTRFYAGIATVGPS
jgi:hypothetical protein